MRVLILGSTGTLGRTMMDILGSRFEVSGTCRPCVDARRFETVEQVFCELEPDVVVNCIGIIKQREEAKDPILLVQVNSLFPQRLAELCERNDTRLILVSTDCVFSGRRGYYKERDYPDPVDMYGRSKLLGEVTDRSHVLTLRTSFIGRELGTSHSLLEWLIGNRGGRVYGYTNAIFSGFTAHVLSRIIGDIIEDFPELCGLYHIASKPISKYDLLVKINEAMQLNIGIVPLETPVCDRSLDATRFFNDSNAYPLPGWDEMIAELAKEECCV